MVEGILGQLRLVELVGPIAQLRVVLAPGEKYPLAVIGNVGPDDVARRELFSQAAQPGMLGLEVAEHVQSAARPRPPAEVLVRHVRPASRRAAHQHEVLEVQQRVGQCLAADRPTGPEVDFPKPVPFRVVGPKPVHFGRHPLQGPGFVIDLGPQAPQAGRQLQPAVDGRLDPLGLGIRPDVGRAPQDALGEPVGLDLFSRGRRGRRVRSSFPRRSNDEQQDHQRRAHPVAYFPANHRASPLPHRGAGTVHCWAGFGRRAPLSPCSRPLQATSLIRYFPFAVSLEPIQARSAIHFSIATPPGVYRPGGFSVLGCHF